jgi:hypothetical protein
MPASGIFIQYFPLDWHIQPQEVDKFAPLLHVGDDVASPHAASPGIANQFIAQSAVCVCCVFFYVLRYGRSWGSKAPDRQVWEGDSLKICSTSPHVRCVFGKCTSEITTASVSVIVAQLF